MPDLAPNSATASPKQAEMLNISVGRRITDWVMTFLSILAVVLVLAPLAAVFGYLLYKGIGSLDLNLLTKMPKPVGEVGGGMANAIAGSALILGIASMIGVPAGIGAGIYLAEYGRGGRFGAIVRFTSDVL